MPLRAGLITSPGEGPISIIALEGEGASTFASKHLGPSGGGKPVTPAGLVYGRFHDGASGEPLDEVIIACIDKSYVEINCHGGAIPARRVLASLGGEGVLVEPPGSMPSRPRPRGSLEEAALAALKTAGTDLAARTFAAQAGGALRKSLEVALNKLEGDLAQARLALKELLETAPFGMALANPQRVAVIGPTNAGKSTLMNALAGFARTIVSETPGTTRDAVSTQVSLRGVPVTMTDTAGAGPTGGVLDAEASQRALKAAGSADAVLAVVDISGTDIYWRPPVLDVPIVIAANKADLGISREAMETANGWGGEVVTLSALRSEGLEAVSDAVLKALGVGGVAGESAESGVLFTKEHIEAVTIALAALCEGDAGQAAAALRDMLK